MTKTNESVWRTYKKVINLKKLLNIKKRELIQECDCNESEDILTIDVTTLEEIGVN